MSRNRVEFLNTEKLVDEINQLITSAQKEIIFIVPYIKLSERTYNSLIEANNKGVEISIVYRESKLSEAEKRKLEGLNNLTLLSDNDIHTKCYLNEDVMIVGSINLYEYSEKFNREMGILVSSETKAYEDGLNEIREIIKSSSIVKKSNKTKEKGFNSTLLRPKYERLYEPCKFLNKYFDNKEFEVDKTFVDGQIVCKNYFEFINVEFEFNNVDFGKTDFEIHRAIIRITKDDETLEKIHHLFWEEHKMNYLRGFKIYWDYYKSGITIYRDKSPNYSWESCDSKKTVERFKTSVDDLAKILKECILKFRR